MPAIGRDAFARVVVDLSAIPKEVRRDIRPALKRIGMRVAQGARARASWSKRIPGAVKVKVLFGSKKQGVIVYVDRNRAPHARAYEGIGTSGANFRHPLFGDRDRWYAQRKRPFLAPAGQAERDTARSEIAQVVEDAARRHGFQ